MIKNNLKFKITQKMSFMKKKKFQNILKKLFSEYIIKKENKK